MAKAKKHEFVDPSDLVVSRSVGADLRQFSIENAPGRLDDFDSQYFAVSGYFGVHDPQVFATAPETLAQLEFAVKLLGAFPALSGSAQVTSMEATVAKARTNTRQDKSS